MNILTQKILHDLEPLPEVMQLEILDFVQFLKTKLEKKKSTELADVLDEASEHNLFAGIDDPVAWQREIRKDRSLPGRDD